MSAHTHRDFFSALLSRIALPTRISGLRALAAVSIFESTLGDEKWNNPLACTIYWPHATPYNTFGNNQHVWRYATFSDGVHATAVLLSGEHWSGVRSVIATAKTRGPILDAFTAAYSWVDWTAASFDGFRHAPFNRTDDLDERLSHPLLGPED